jgi:hypothetical protein
MQLEQQQKAVDQLLGNTRMLEGKLAEARAASAKTSKQIQEMIGSLNTSNSVVAFEKMEEKVRLRRGGGCWCRCWHSNIRSPRVVWGYKQLLAACVKMEGRVWCVLEGRGIAGCCLGGVMGTTGVNAAYGFALGVLGRMRCIQLAFSNHSSVLALPLMWCLYVVAMCMPLRLMPSSDCRANIHLPSMHVTAR